MSSTDSRAILLLWNKCNFPEFELQAEMKAEMHKNGTPHYANMPFLLHTCMDTVVTNSQSRTATPTLVPHTKLTHTKHTHTNTHTSTPTPTHAKHTHTNTHTSTHPHPHTYQIEAPTYLVYYIIIY